MLQRWLADEARVRERFEAGSAAAADQPTDPREFAAQPAIALFDAMMAGRLPGAPIARTLDFLPVLIEPGHAIFQGTPKLAHYNPIGSVHGGWFATLLDSALGCAVHSALPPGKAYTTLELKINIVRALTTKVPRVRADGRIVHLGSQTATAEARMIGPDGKLYAHGTTTCLVFPIRSA
ncbi:MAG: PaaI family thioesterase [Lautropia sp.]